MHFLGFPSSYVVVFMVVIVVVVGGRDLGGRWEPKYATHIELTWRVY